MAAMIEARPEVISSIMGVYPEHLVKKMKEAKIRWGWHGLWNRLLNALKPRNIIRNPY